MARLWKFRTYSPRFAERRRDSNSTHDFTRDLILVVQRCELVIPPVRLAGTHRIRLSGGMEFESKISSGVVSLNRLPEGVTLGPIKTGILRVGLETKGNVGDLASWDTTGRLRFSNGTVKMDRLLNPIRDMSMVLHFDRQNIDVRHVMFNIGDSDIRITGSIAHWLDAPRGKLVVQSSQVDLQSFQTTGETKASSQAVFPILTSWWAGGKVDATLFIDQSVLSAVPSLWLLKSRQLRAWCAEGRSDQRRYK